MAGKELIEININNTVWVRLTDKGYQHRADYHNRWLGAIPNLVRRTADDFKAEADSEGWTEFQLWCFMEEFGEVTKIGFDLPYHTNIRFNAKDVKPVSNKALNRETFHVKQ